MVENICGGMFVCFSSEPLAPLCVGTLQQYKFIPKPAQFLILRSLMGRSLPKTPNTACNYATAKEPSTFANHRIFGSAEIVGNPTYSYDDTIARDTQQLPNDFEQEWRPQLPTRLKFSNFPKIGNLALICFGKFAFRTVCNVPD